MMSVLTPTGEQTVGMPSAMNCNAFSPHLPLLQRSSGKRHHADIDRAEIFQLRVSTPTHRFNVDRRAFDKSAYRSHANETIRVPRVSSARLAGCRDVGPCCNFRSNQSTVGPDESFWRRHLILFGVDRRGNHSDAIVDLARVLREIRITNHHVRRDAADCFCL